ncbi:MAG: SoxR reducing system RseC family protein [Clostridia bacterium]|nr:SoxR reducing system RseC family protein [Clostridia bacterium]
MKEIGLVHKIKGNTATIRFERKTACENCNMCLKPKEEMYVELKVRNSLNAKVGDKVEVTMGQRAVLTASFIVYVMPLLVMFVVIGCTYKMDVWISLVASLGSLIVSFIGVAIIDKLIIKKKVDYLPVMSAIINEEIEQAIDRKE